MALYLERYWNTQEAEGLLELWARLLVSQNRPKSRGFPSPYWTQERVLARTFGMLPPRDNENSTGHSNTLTSALDMLVRRLRRQLIAQVWPSASRIDSCDFVPDHLADYFSWTVAQGALEIVRPEATASWSRWRSETIATRPEQIPLLLRRHPEWLAPFLLTYPHRANKALSGFADRVSASSAPSPV